MKELLSRNDRARSLSVATDTSIASILSNSDQLIPDAFKPVDIQVMSQRRVRPASSGTMTQSGGNTTPLKGSSSSNQMSGQGQYYNNSGHANAAFMRYMTASTSASTSGSIPISNINVYSSNSDHYQTKRKSYVDHGDSGVLPHPEDDDDDPSSQSRRSSNHSNLSTRDLVKGYV